MSVRAFTLAVASLAVTSSAWTVSSRLVQSVSDRYSVQYSIDGSTTTATRILQVGLDSTGWAGKTVIATATQGTCGAPVLAVSNAPGVGPTVSATWSNSFEGSCQFQLEFRSEDGTSVDGRRDPSWPNSSTMYQYAPQVSLLVAGQSAWGRSWTRIGARPGSNLSGYSLWGTRSVKIGDRVQVLSGWTGSNTYVEVGADSRVRSLVSGGNVYLRERATVLGDALSRSGISKQNSTLVTGSEQVVGVFSHSIPKRTVVPGTENVSVWSNTTRTLAPSARGDLVAHTGSVVRISAGAYAFKSFVLDVGSILEVDLSQGAVSLDVRDNIQIGDRCVVRLVGSADPFAFSLYTNQTLSMRIGTDADFHGALSAPNALVTAYSRTWLEGAIFADQVVLEPDMGGIAGATVNAPPVFTTTPTLNTKEAQAWQYAFAASDVDGDPLSFTVGTLPSCMVYDTSARTLRWTPGFDQAGSYPLSISVTDGRSNPVPQSWTLVVADSNRAPYIVSNPATSVDVGQSYSYVVDAVDDDGDVLTYLADNLPTGMAFVAATKTFSWTPTAAQVGPYALSVKVKDVKGDSAEQQWVLRVVQPNRPPVITSTPGTTGKEGEVYSYFVTATDADGDALTFFAGDMPEGMAFDIATHTFTWMPGFDQSGSQHLKVSVTDANSEPVDQEWDVVIDNVNRPPVFTSNPGTTGKEGDAYSYHVTASDPDGDALVFSAGEMPSGMAFDVATQTFAWTPGFDQADNYPLTVNVSDGTASVPQKWTLRIDNLNRPPVITSTPATTGKEGEVYSYHVTATDPDGDVLAYSAGDMPDGMTLDVATQVFAWTPGFDQSGVHRLKAIVTDGKSEPVEQSWELNVDNANRPPVITSTPVATGKEGEAYSYHVTASDPDGDALIFSAGEMPSGMAFDVGTQTFAWTPGFDQADNYPMTVNVSDGTASVPQNWTLRIDNLNRPPVITSTPVTSGKEGEVYSYHVTATDPDGDVLVYSAGDMPDGMTFDAASQVFAWTPGFDQSGVHRLKAIVTDGKSVPVEQSWELNVDNANRPPVITSTPAKTVREGETYTYKVVATDADGDAMTFTASALPDGMTFNPATQTFKWTPGYNQSAIYPLSVSVSDVWNPPQMQSWTLVVENNNRFPSITSIPASRVREDSVYRYEVSASDPDVGDQLTYELLSGPQGVSIDASTGVVNWNAPVRNGGSILESDSSCMEHRLVNSDGRRRVADVLFVVDESGSMGGAHEWLQDIPQPFEALMREKRIGIGDNGNRFGLVGFDHEGRSIRTNSQLWVDHQQIRTAMTALTTMRGTFEDGYNGIQFALDTLDFRPETARNMVLVTDEPRSIYKTALTYDSMLRALQKERVILNSVIAAKLICPDGRTALGMSFDGKGFMADGYGGFEVCVGASVLNMSSIEPYAKLAWATRGAIWDISVLREGGLAVQSFTNALVEIKVQEIQEQLDSRPLSDLAISSVQVRSGEMSFRIINRGIMRASDSRLVLSDSTGDFDTLDIPSLVAGAAYDGVADISGRNIQGEIIRAYVMTGDTSFDCHTGNNEKAVYLLSIQVADPHGASVRQDWGLEVDIANHAPIVLPIKNSIATIGKEFSEFLLVSDVDPGDGHRFQLISGPSGLVIAPWSGRLSWTPQSTQIGTHVFDVVATDLQGLSDTLSVTVEVVQESQAPRFLSVPLERAEPNQQYVYEPIVAAAPGAKLRYQLFDESPGILLDSISGKVVIATPSTPGAIDFTLFVHDQNGKYAVQTAYIYVETFIPPRIVTTPPKYATVEQVIVYSPVVSDLSWRERHRWTLDMAGVGAVIDTTTGRLTWTPATDVYHPQTVLGGQNLSCLDYSDTAWYNLADRVRWRRQSFTTLSSPIVARLGLGAAGLTSRSIIVVTAVDSVATTPRLHAMDLATGDLQWSFNFRTPDFYVTPAVVRLGDGVDDNLIVFLDVDRYLVALSRKGEMVWTSNAPANTGGQKTAILAKDIDGDGLKEIIAGSSVFSSSGRLLWSFPIQGNSGYPVYPLVVGAESGGPGRILHRGEMRDASGNLVWKTYTGVTNPVTSSFYSLIPGDAPELDRIVASEMVSGHARFSLIGADGKVIVQWTDPALTQVGPLLVGQFDESLSPSVYSASNRAMLRLDGTIAWNNLLYGAPEVSSTTVPIATDLDGSGGIEIILPTSTGPRIIEAASGIEIERLSNWNTTYNGSVLLQGIDSLGDMLVLSGTGLSVLQSQGGVWKGGKYEIIDRGDILGFVGHSNTSGRLRQVRSDLAVALSVIALNETESRLDVRIWNRGFGISSPVQVEIRRKLLNGAAVVHASIGVDTIHPGSSRLINVPIANADLFQSGRIDAILSRPDVNSCSNWDDTAQIVPFRITVRDRSNLAGKQEWVMEMLDKWSVPTVTTTAPTVGHEGTVYQHAIQASSLHQGDNLRFQLIQGPQGMRLHPTSGYITWDIPWGANGSYPIYVKVVSRNSTSRDLSWSIAVLPSTVPNLPPVFTSTPRTSHSSSSTYMDTVHATDPEGMAIQYSLLNAPAGSTIDALTGAIRWTPSIAVGRYDYRVVATDQRGGRDTLSWVLVFKPNGNRSPTISVRPDTLLEIGAAYSSTVVVFDPDGDPLRYFLLAGPSGMAIGESSGLITWQSSPQDTPAVHVVKIQVEDNDGGSVIDSIELHLVRGKATWKISSTPSMLGRVGELYSYTPTFVGIASGQVRLTLLRSPAQAVVDAAGSISWTPSAQQEGLVTFELSVVDESGMGTIQNWTVAVRRQGNSPPIFTSVPPVAVAAGTAFGYTALAMDADGEAVWFTRVSGPVGSSISSTGIVTWIPTVSQSGAADFVIRATDARGLFTDQSFRVKVTPERVPPTISLSVFPVPVNQGQSFTVYLNANDNVGVVSRSLSLDGKPLAIGNAGYITANVSEAGEHYLVASAVDAAGNVGHATLKFNANNPYLTDTLGPVITLSWSPTTPRPSQNVQFSTTIHDPSGYDPTLRSLRIDGKVIALNASNQGTWTAPYNGTFPVQMIARDNAGNISTLERTIVVSSTATSILAPPTVSLIHADSIILPDSVATDPATDDSFVVSGTARSDSLAYYVIEVRQFGSETWREVYRSNRNVVDGRLGAIDATQLENGPWEYRVRATDIRGQQTFAAETFTVVGEKKIGIFTIAFQDLNLPASGIDITATRTYDSRTRATRGDFGYGWSLDLSRVKVRENGLQGTGWDYRWVGGPLNREFVALREHLVTIQIPGLRTQEFVAKAVYNRTCTGSNCVTDPSSGYMTYEAKPGTYGKLEPADISRDFVIMGGELWDPNGDFQEQYNPNEYNLTLADGSVWWVDQTAGRVFQIRDPNGNVLQFSGNQIVHSNGTGLQLQRDGSNRVTEIRDGTGRSMRYTYDVDGNLSAVVDPMGFKTRFLYDASHYLTDIIDPRGVKALRIEYDSAGRVVRQITAKGDTVTSVHDLANNREISVEPDGDSVAYTYNDRGDVTSKVVNGHTWRYTVDGNGKVTRTDNPDGTYTTSVYDASGNETESVDALGNRTTRIFLAGSDKLLSETDPLGRTSHYEYDSRGNLVRSVGPDGRAQIRQGLDAKGNVVLDTSATGEVTAYTYDASSHRLSQTDAKGRMTRWTYDARGNVLTETDAQGRVTRHTYDANGNRTSTIAPDGKVSQTEYTSFGKPRAVTDALGRKTQTVYDATGQATVTIRADGSSTSRGYDATGNVTSTTDAVGRTTAMRYDAEGRLLGTTFADSAEVKSEYDAMGRRVASIDAKGIRTEYEYDAAGRDTLVRDAQGHVTKSRYDAVGRKVEVMDALNRSTKTRYDLYDRVTKVIYPDNSFDSTEYDAAGRKTATVDAMYRRTEFGYDEVGQLTSVKDPSGEITRYGYDANGNRVSQTDAKGRVTAFRYDALNRQTAKVYPDGAVDSTEYDAVGQVSRHVAPNGDITRFEYDVLGREVKRTLPSGKTITTTWNVDGSRASILDERGLTLYGYDGRGRLASVTRPDGIVLTYGYDKSGQIVKRGTPWGEVRYVVNALGQIDTVVDSRAGATSYGYDALGRTTSVSRPNGVQSIYGYTDRGLLGMVRHVSGASEVASFAYTFDASGLRTGAGETFGGVANPVTWTHDLNMRLTDETRAGATQSWGYDAVSNRTSQSAGGSSITTVFDMRDRLTSLGQASFVWDASGRLRARAEGASITRYTWTDNDRLTRVELPSGGSVSYGYDAQGLMVSRTSATGTTNFVWDGTLPYGQVVATTSALGALDSRWVYGTDRLAEIHADTVLWLLTDGLGNVRAVTDSVGGVVGRADFDAWGNRTVDSGRTSAFGYRGEWADTATGMVYLRARWMDPTTGRFVSEDPWEGDPNGPVSLHRYLYANSGPVIGVDPSGEFTLLEISVAGAALGALAGGGAYTMLHPPGSKDPDKQFSWKGWALWSASGAAAGATIGASVYYGMTLLGISGPTTILTVSSGAGTVGYRVSNTAIDRWTSTGNAARHVGAHLGQARTILQNSAYSAEEYLADAAAVVETYVGPNLVSRGDRVVVQFFARSASLKEKYWYIVLNAEDKIKTAYFLDWKEIVRKIPQLKGG